MTIEWWKRYRLDLDLESSEFDDFENFGCFGDFGDFEDFDDFGDLVGFEGAHFSSSSASENVIDAADRPFLSLCFFPFCFERVLWVRSIDIDL